MKALAILAVISATNLSVPAEQPTWQDLSARLFTNAAIVWQAPTDKLPKNIWIYQRALPHVFPATVISNAMVLGSLQNKGFPKPSTNDFFISEDRGPDYPGAIPTIFGIQPGDATLYYWMPNHNAGSGSGIPSGETISRRALNYATRLGLDPAKLVLERFYTNLCEVSPDGKATKIICGRGVFFSRLLDGIAFFSADNEGSAAEGISLEVGSLGKIRSFFIRWSGLTRYQSEATASQQDIIQCIQAHVTMVLPGADEPDYFARLKKLATAKKLTIIKITPYYGEGVFGEVPTNDAPCHFALPLAELEAVANYGSSNDPVRLLSPITTSEVNRLLGK